MKKKSLRIVNRDPQIVQMLNELSADSLRAHVDGLVRFSTRNTLSSRNSTATRGLCAAVISFCTILLVM